MNGCFDNHAIFTTTAGPRLRCFLSADGSRSVAICKMARFELHECVL